MQIKSFWRMKVIRLYKNKIKIISVYVLSVFSFKYLNIVLQQKSGLVAQWLEHTLDKRGVESSTLSRPTTF